jgi:aspartate aminotransferase-like enzyme
MKTINDEVWWKWEQQLNLAPGSSDLIPSVRERMQRHYVNPWNQDFMTFYEETCERLKGLFNTRHDVIIQVGPIRVAMDTAINSIVEPGDKVIICRNGHWSDQFRILVELSGGEPIIIDDVWGRSFSVDLLRDEIKRYRGQAKALVLTHVETSTGIVNPVAEVGRVARENDLLFILDSAQSLGGMEVRMDEWNVDLCIGGSHKCMSAPAGTAFLAISPRVWETIRKRAVQIRGWFTNLEIWRDIANWTHLITWPTSAMYGLQASLDIIAEDPHRIYKRHAVAAKAIRWGVSEMGLKLIPDGSNCPGCDSPDRICSDTSTAVCYPPGVNYESLSGILYSRYNVAIGGGLGKLREKNFRFGPTGLSQIAPGAVMHGLSSVGMTLKELGVNMEVERGLMAARSVLDEMP